MDSTVRPARLFLIFLRLGCLSFGGPAAHLGYFRGEFVERRQWLSEAAFAELVALAQALPGPASSQVGYAVGVTCGGLRGGVAAFLGFTIPSAVLMIAFAYGHGITSLHGLQLAAVAVVAHAVIAMQRVLAPDEKRWALLLMGSWLALALPGWGAPAAVLAGALLSAWWLRDEHVVVESRRRLLPLRVGVIAICLFVMLLLAAWAGSGRGPDELGLAAVFYRTGSMVFGGGHVVLPFLEQVLVPRGWITEQSFLAGYGAAQALPGPLFTFGAYLGASIGGASTGAGIRSLGCALASVVGLFLPGLLLMTAAMAFTGGQGRNASVRAALQGVNATVVGVLLAALYQPIWTSTVHTAFDFGLVVLAFAALRIWRISPLAVVIGMSVLGSAWSPI